MQIIAKGFGPDDEGTALIPACEQVQYLNSSVLSRV